MKKAGIRFDDSEAGHICAPVFVISLLVRAWCAAVLPGEKNCIYHVCAESDTQTRARKEASETCLELIAMLRRAWEPGEAHSFDLDRFMWFRVRDLFYIFRFTEAEAGQKQAVYDALRPCAQNLRVLSPCPVFPPEEACLLTEYTAALYPDAAEGSGRPRRMHKQVSASRLPTREEVRAAARETDYPGFRNLRAGANAYLGREEAEAAPEILTVDIRGKQNRDTGAGLSRGKRTAVMQGYPRMEELRGFEPQEVPCRLTLFPLDDVSGDILVTWDARFIHPSAADWLLEKIRS